MPHVVVIANPASAALRSAGIEALRREVGLHLDARGWDAADLLETDPRDGGAGAARNAVAAGADLVLVAGGDRTVRTVAETLADTDVALGVLPAGIDNRLACALGVPLDASSAIATALDGDQLPLDLARLDDGAGPFAAMAGLGADLATLRTADRFNGTQAGWPAYSLVGEDTIQGHGFAVEISLDGAPAIRRRALGVLVGNAGADRSDLPLLPRTAENTALLDVYVLAPRTTGAKIAGLARGVLRRPAEPDDVRWERWQAGRVIVRAAEHQPRSLDGAPIAPSSALDASIVPGAVLVRVPAGAGLRPRETVDIGAGSRR